MNNVERCRAVFAFQPVDRLPRWEWATWWHLTIDRWRGEGLPDAVAEGGAFAISEWFGLDPYRQFWFGTVDGNADAALRGMVGKINSMDDYLTLRPALFPEPAPEGLEEAMRPWGERQARGEVVLWSTLEGFFWFPRTLMDFERLSLAYYDQPELIHRMNEDLTEHNLRLLRRILAVAKPTFFTLAEDMSYNHGPMISEHTFYEFSAPYYRRITEVLREHDVPLIVDTDGDVTLMAPWLLDVGVTGVLPLERQAGVNGMALRESFPTMVMIGHFDKMTMNRGEDAMRAEFERLMPIVRSGGFIPSVDHQTPPGVSLEQYRCYLKLLWEYTERGGA
jgi:hypothetical protein